MYESLLTLTTYDFCLFFYKVHVEWNLIGQSQETKVIIINHILRDRPIQNNWTDPIYSVTKQNWSRKNPNQIFKIRTEIFLELVQAVITIRIVKVLSHSIIAIWIVILILDVSFWKKILGHSHSLIAQASRVKDSFSTSLPFL